MVLNRHELACYRRLRKRGLLTQIVLIIAFVLHYHPLYEQRGCLETVPILKPCWHTSFTRAAVILFSTCLDSIKYRDYACRTKSTRVIQLV